MNAAEDRSLVIDGAYQELFAEFIAYKQASGCVYGISIQHRIREFSRFLATKQPIPEVVSREYYEQFCSKREEERSTNQATRAAYVRQFCLFLQFRGYECFIPPGYQCKEDELSTPYIISEKEMASLLAVADREQSYPKSPYAQRVFPMLIRLLWCCVLRVGEAVALTVGDVDVTSGVLNVMHAKNNRARLVPLSGSCTEYARAYCEKMGFGQADKESPFFPSPRGDGYCRGTASLRIKHLMEKAGITIDGVRTPRTHDIRHSYAVRALEKMEDDGMDIYCCLPLLSIYMGHHDIKSTEYYLRLIESGAKRIEAAMADVYANVFPEVG